MTTFRAFAHLAMTVPETGPLANTAKGLCMIRGEDPFQYAHAEEFYLQRWRLAIIESMLMCAINEELAA